MKTLYAASLLHLSPEREPPIEMKHGRSSTHEQTTWAHPAAKLVNKVGVDSTEYNAIG